MDARKSNETERVESLQPSIATPITTTNAAPVERTSADASPVKSFADMRFRALLGPKRWELLPSAVRRRFGKRLADARTVSYTGRIVSCRMNLAGRVLAQTLRLIGGPLPTNCDIDVPAAVLVTEDATNKGQFWTRVYGRKRGFPKIIGSSKRFQGPTGLEEYIGYGIGMALNVAADEHALHFHSDHYFFTAGKYRLRLPTWLTPGALMVSHIDVGEGNFEFVLKLDHPYFGELLHQVALFTDA